MLIMLFASASARAECSHASYEALRPPKYPAAAAAAHMEGRVLVSIIVHADGRATDASVRESSGHDELDLAAMDAVSSWRYTPRTCDGKTMAEEVWVPIEFDLGRSPTVDAPRDAGGSPSTARGARGYSLERDETPLPGVTARAALQSLRQDAGVERAFTRMFDLETTKTVYLLRRTREMYEVFESTEGNWSVANGGSMFVLRLRDSETHTLLYRVACEGSSVWCEYVERREVDFLARNPPPPMPPAPDEDAH